MTRARCDYLAARAEAPGAGLVTTEKDWVAPAAGLAPPGHRLAGAARFEDEAALDRVLLATVASPENR